MSKSSKKGKKNVQKASGSRTGSNAFGGATRPWLFGLLALTLIIYLPILKADFLNYDDDLYLTENPLILDLNGENLRKLFTSFFGNQYSPVAMLIMALEVKIFGLNPAALKFFSIILHLLNTTATFVFVKKLFGKPEFALAIAGIFAVHTLQVESVAWMAASMKIGTYSLFSLLSLIYYLKFQEEGKKTGHYLASVSLFLLACMSKEQAVVLPGLLIAIDYFKERNWLSGKVLLEKAPYFILAVIFGLATLTVADDMRGTEEALPYSIGERVVFASYALNAYLFKSLIPVELSTFYVYPLIGKTPSWYYLTIPIALAMLYLLYASWKKGNRLMVFGILFFLINLALTFVSQILSVRDVIMADRYMYLSVAGFFMAFLPWLQARITSKFGGSAYQRILMAYILALAVMSFLRTSVWTNDASFMGNAIEQAEKWHKEKSPAMAVTYTNLGVARRKEGKTEEAMSLYRQALICNPRHALAYGNIANLQMTSGQLQDAEANYNKALEIDANYENALSGRGAVYAQLGRFDEAFKDLNRAIELDPDFVDAYSNRSLTYHAMGNLPKAIEDLDKLVQLEPGNAAFFHDRGVLLSLQNRKQEGLESISRAIQLNPAKGEYYVNRSKIYLDLGQRQQAQQDARKAQELGVQIDPGFLQSLQ